MRLLIVAALVAAHHAPAQRCHSTRCDERVAMHQCAQSRPVPCIRRAALHHHVSFRLQLAIARCESRLQPAVLNHGGSGSSGLMQFMPATFGTTPYAGRWILSAKWNALAGAWALRHWGTGPWAASRHCWG
jgi:soluble lytic murein transglycosylase-like protein